MDAATTARHAGFVGRDRLLARLDRLLLEDDSDRWVLVTGGPGMGKSAILAAWLARRPQAGAAVPHHFIRRGEGGWDDHARITGSLAAQIEVANETPSLPSGALVDLALTTLLNDTGTVINRQTAPSSGIGAFTTQPAFVNVPGPGNLPSGPAPNAAGAQGVWLRLTLPAGATAYKGSAALRIQGTTT